MQPFACQFDHSRVPGPHWPQFGKMCTFPTDVEVSRNTSAIGATSTDTIPNQQDSDRSAFLIPKREIFW